MFDMLMGIGTGLAGAAAQYFGGRETNRSNETIANNATSANREEAQINRDFQSREAATARQWEEQMSNTAYQRQAADMKAAGINPIVAIGNGASTPNASVPSGAQASAETTTLQNPMAGMSSWISSGLEAAKLGAQLDNMNEQKKLMEAQRIKTGVDTEVAKKGEPASKIINNLYNWGSDAFKKARERWNMFEKKKTNEHFNTRIN